MIRETDHHYRRLMCFRRTKEKGLAVPNPSSNRVFTELESHLSNILLTSGLRVRISRGFFSRYYHKDIDLGNKSKATFLKVDLTYRIDEADGTNLPIHSGCLPVFSSIIIHPDDLDFVSWFHGSEILRVWHTTSQICLSEPEASVYLAILTRPVRWATLPFWILSRSLICSLSQHEQLNQVVSMQQVPSCDL